MARKAFIVAALCAVGVAAVGVRSASADVVIGNFEGGVAEPGWGEWGAGVEPFSSIITVSNEAATLGTGSVKIVKSGYDQNLAYSAGTAGTRSAFAANNKVVFDVIFPATTTGGFAQIFELALNSPAGFIGKSYTADSAGWGATGGAAITKTFEYDYTSQKAAMGANPSYVELIFATNSDANHGTFYIDNVRLVATPEPATLAASLASLGLLGRRRRR